MAWQGWFFLAQLLLHVYKSKAGRWGSWGSSSLASQTVDPEFSWGGWQNPSTWALHVVKVYSQQGDHALKERQLEVNFLFEAQTFTAFYLIERSHGAHLRSILDQRMRLPVEPRPCHAVRRKAYDGAVVLGKSSLPQFKEEKQEQASVKSKSTEF